MPARASIDPDWTALNRLLDDVLDVPESVRSRWLDELPAEHDALRPRLRHLLRGSNAAGRMFLRTIPKVDDAGTGTDPIEDLAEPPLIGSYEIVRKLGEGGMGTVWLAHRIDVMVNRFVALKLPRRARLAWRFPERMANEREILAALNHPNIARLYDAGVTAAGQPYLALEYVAGVPIDAYVKARSLPVRERLRLFVLAARAVAHAHSRMIVHGDLKPSNVLVTDTGEVKLLDFGIARLLNDGRLTDGETAPGRLLTPQYASPEQLAGETLGTATDVYSAGVMLGELLSGVRPDDARTDDRAQGPLRGDLGAIVRQALQERPDTRYPTMDAMADDIERYLGRLPVRARPGTLRYRAAKWVSRNRLVFAAGAIAVAALVAGTVLATWHARAAQIEKMHAEEVRDFLATLIRDASPYDGGAAAPSTVEWLRHARDRIDRNLSGRPELRVELLSLIGSSLLTLQDTAGAEEVLSRAVEEGTRHLGGHDARTLRARVLMTGVDRFRGRTAAMRTELAALLPILRAHPARFAEDLAVALKNQAHLEMDAGHYEAAERAAREEVDVARRTFGADHPETVTAEMMVALTYQYSRSPDEALAAAEWAFVAAQRTFGDAPTHPRIIEARFLYGRALGDAGKVVRGVGQLTRAVSDAAEVFGPSSRMVGIYSLSLAAQQLETGDVAAAIRNSESGAAIVARHSDRDSFRYANALFQRGAARLAARRPEAALPDLDEAVLTLRRTLPVGHATTRLVEATRALALARIGRYREARELLEPLVAAPSPADQPVAIASYVMGIVERMSGRSAAALENEERALKFMAGDNAEVRRMRVLTEIGLAQLDLGRREEARAALGQALQLSERHQTNTSPDRADIRAGLARAR
jgi:serine/threonine-protein kinase